MLGILGIMLLKLLSHLNLLELKLLGQLPMPLLPVPMLVPPPSLLVLLHLLKVDKLKTMPLLRILILDLELLALLLY